MAWSDGSDHRAVVVGVLPDQPLWVVQVAGEYAQAFDAELVCVTVDQSRYAFQELPDGTLLTAPIDPDVLAPEPLVSDDRRRRIGELIDPLGVEWSVRTMVGVAADSLADVADETDALMIVVGVRERGVLGAVRQMFAGSVAARLSQRQYRPVVIVPVDPAADDRAEGAEDS